MSELAANALVQRIRRRQEKVVQKKCITLPEKSLYYTNTKIRIEKANNESGYLMLNEAGVWTSYKKNPSALVNRIKCKSLLLRSEKDLDKIDDSIRKDFENVQPTREPRLKRLLASLKANTSTQRMNYSSFEQNKYEQIEESDDDSQIIIHPYIPTSEDFHQDKKVCAIRAQLEACRYAIQEYDAQFNSDPKLISFRTACQNRLGPAFSSPSSNPVS